MGAGVAAISIVALVIVKRGCRLESCLFPLDSNYLIIGEELGNHKLLPTNFQLCVQDER
jgi:hypothetical protein